jgi:hypothetical protein
MRQLFALPATTSRLISRHITNKQRALPNITSESAQHNEETRDALEPEAYTVTERRNVVVQNISNEISDLTRRLFAVIHIQRVRITNKTKKFEKII